MLRSIVLISALAALVAVLGCSKGISHSNADLEEQKLRLEVMRVEREELTSLLETQKRLRVENQRAIQEMERRRTELRTLQQSVEKQQEHLDADMARANAKLAMAEDRLNARVQELKTLEATNQKQIEAIAAGKRELAAGFASMQSGRGSGARSTVAPLQQTERDRQKQAAERELAHRQYLESLADATVAIMKGNPMSIAYGNPQLARKQLIERLQATKPSDSERQFQDAAKRAAEEFARQSTKGSLTAAEVAKIRDFVSQQTNRQPSLK
jgi:hypothetical protein